MKRQADTRGSTLAANGAPPAEATCFYEGNVMHQRLKPVGHRFDYRVFSLAIDVDRLDEADRQSRLFSVNRANLLSFREIDHTRNPSVTVAEHARTLLRDAGVETPAARILLVCYPRVFGIVFNPLAVYYAYDAEGALIGLIYEVRNTFGERHIYTLPVRDGELSESGLRQEADKVFHVSPFIAMNMRYHFRMLPPGEEIRWRILETDPDGPLLSATFSGVRRALTTKSILALSVRVPFLPVRILGGIHWEALKLWVKGMAYIPRPAKSPAPSTATLRAPVQTLAEAGE